MNTLALPPLYRRWVDAILKHDIYSEPRATCNDCAMCTYIQPPAKGDNYFNSNTKCCSYHPVLPNYLVGAILTDNDPSLNEVKEQFMSRVLNSLITPYGISPTYWASLYYNIKPFGKDIKLLCPFYLDHSGGCGIWKYRNGVCSAYFCKHERGQIGWRFWRQLTEMLAFVEKTLSQYCVEKLPVIIPENAADIREQTWGNWTFREAEFFMNCWNFVQPLRWNEVLKIGGAELESLVKKLENSSNALQSKILPDALKTKYFRSEDVAEGLTRVWSYSSQNPLDLPTELIHVLDYFDGRPVSEVLNQIQKEKMITIDTDLLQKLTDYKILVPA